MVTNLPAEAKAKWIKVMEAKTPEEKLVALQEFLSAVPKHKGTENLVMWAKRRMAELREEIEVRQRKRGGSKESPFFIEKNGDAQVVLLSYSEEIKDNFMERVVKVHSNKHEKPFPVMLDFEGVKIQIINPPSLSGSKSSYDSRIMSLARNSDLVTLILSNNNGELGQLISLAREHGIRFSKSSKKVIINRIREGKTGIRIVVHGKLINSNEKDLIEILKGYGINSAIVKIYGDIDSNEFEDHVMGRIVYKPYIIVSSTCAGISDTCLEIGYVNQNSFGKIVFNELQLLRVYTKEPDEQPSKKPLVLKQGATVYEVAEKLHSEFKDKLRYARIWGPSAQFPGQKVGGDHVLKDGDIIELHFR